MANQDNKTFVDTMVDAQKEMMNSVVENAKKFTNGNTAVSETVAKGTEWYTNWLDNQKKTFSAATEKTTDAVNNAQDNSQRMSEYYQNWYNNQMNTTKQMWEMNQNMMKGFAPNTSSNNPLEMMQNGWSNMQNWMTNMQNMNTMQSMNPFSMMNGANNNMNPFNMMNSFKDMGSNATSMFNEWYNLLNKNFSELQGNMKNGTAQDAYRNMINTTEGFTRFAEMWTPMWKSIQEKTFNTDLYKQFMNPAKYQEFMDKFFSFMPENVRTYMHQAAEMMKHNMQQNGGQLMNGYHQMRGMMGNMPGMQGTEMFTNMLNMYTNMQHMMQQAASPITRMMGDNKNTKQMMEWQDIANRMMIFSIKNSEMQYMMYQQGTKVMDKLAENVMHKMQHGEEINSMMALYQEWMNISDKSFVSLFESDDYSKVMAEVSALQLKLRKDVELQMEGAMKSIPVATRSEMDEMYKTIYDLKKQVRQLERMMEMESTEEATTPAAATTATAENTNASTTAPKATNRKK